MIEFQKCIKCKAIGKDVIAFAAKMCKQHYWEARKNLEREKRIREVLNDMEI